MSTQMIVYIASIVTTVSACCFTFGLACYLAVCLSFIVAYLEQKTYVTKTWYKATCVVAVLLGTFLLWACAVIPSENNVYKIAGVSDQQKAKIDASGKLIQEKTQH